MAARLYAPLGTRMSLGDYVRVVRAFVEGSRSGGRLRMKRRTGLSMSRGCTTSPAPP